MSNLTVGKIVNNSLTLVLNSKDGEGVDDGDVLISDVAKTVRGLSYRIHKVPHSQGTMTVATGRFFADVIHDDFFERDVDRTPIDGPTVKVGEYYVVTAVGTQAEVGTKWATVTNTTNLHNATAFNGGGFNAFMAANAGKKGLVVKINVAGTLTPSNKGYKISGPGDVFTRRRLLGTEETAADAAKQVTFTAKLASQTNAADRVPPFFSNTYDHTNFKVNLPNISAFPHKTRCLCQVVSVRHQSVLIDDYYLGGLLVRIPQMGGHTIFFGKEMLNGVVGVVTQSGQTNKQGKGTTHEQKMSLLDSATMCQSPFGKQLDVSIVDVASMERPVYDSLRTNPIVVVLRLLFLDNEDLKDF